MLHYIMSEDDQEINIARLIRDPNLVKNRIFIGNLPTCTREELQSICYSYGTVLGSMVQKNFGFVQFESEEIANKAASSLNKSIFKGNVITVRNAGMKQVAQVVAPKRQATTLLNPTMKEISFLQKKAPGGCAVPNMSIEAVSLHANSEFNDCEIIVVDRRNTKYAEYIEDRLKCLSLRVDVLFPNLEVGLGKVLASISARGCLYAVLVTGQHVEHSSITVNILHGQPAEHRNMPLEEAIKLISEDFRTHFMKATKLNKLGSDSSVPISQFNFIRDHHPDSVQKLLHLLVNNMPLTSWQYEQLINYLQQQRDYQASIKIESSGIKRPKKDLDPEIMIQKKIFNILKKPRKTNLIYALYTNMQEIKQDSKLMELLKNLRIRQALDILVDLKMFKSVEKIV